ncbi:unnamed protein product, partial [Prorocentrum cordatum]
VARSERSRSTRHWRTAAPAWAQKRRGPATPMASRRCLCLSLLLLSVLSAIGVLLSLGDLDTALAGGGGGGGERDTAAGGQRAAGGGSGGEPNAAASGQPAAGGGGGSARPAENIHLVYQLSCGAFSLHQAIAFDWSWREIGQPGRLTRLVCGCTSVRDQERLSTSPLEGDPRFAVLFSEEWNDYVPTVYPQARGDNYKIYNKVWAFRDWLERAWPQEDYIAFLDPDMVFTRPLLHHLPAGEGDGALPRAMPGRPVGQWYHYIRPYCPTPCAGGDPGWAEFSIPEVCGDLCPQVPQDVGGFAVGPPMILHREDWRRLVPLWCNYTVEIRARAVQKSDGNAWLGGKGAKTGGHRGDAGVRPRRRRAAHAPRGGARGHRLRGPEQLPLRRRGPGRAPPRARGGGPLLRRAAGPAPLLLRAERGDPVRALDLEQVPHHGAQTDAPPPPPPPSHPPSPG